MIALASSRSHSFILFSPNVSFSLTSRLTMAVIFFFPVLPCFPSSVASLLLFHVLAYFLPCFPSCLAFRLPYLLSSFAHFLPCLPEPSSLLTLFLVSYRIVSYNNLLARLIHSLYLATITDHHFMNKQNRIGKTHINQILQ